MGLKYNRPNNWADLYSSESGLGNPNRDLPRWIVTGEFDSTYYSGLDVSVYFNNIYIDEAVALQYQELEQVKPVFSYADYTPRRFSHGSRMIQGTFTINFKDSGYITKILQRLANEEGTDKDIKTLSKKMATKNLTLQQAALGGDFTLEDIVNVANQNDPNAYRDYMDSFDETYWGVNNNATSRTTDRIMKRPRYATTKEGFDILVKFGQPEEVRNNQYPSYDKWGTLEIIRGCDIGSYAKAIDDSGRNILEVYSFVGRSIS